MGFKRFSLCFIAIIILSAFAFSRVTAGTNATLSATVDYSSGVGVISISGSWWASTPVVNVYWDVQDANHQIAQCTPMGGTIMATVSIPDTPLGLHHVIGVQGTTTVTIPFTLTAVSPADDRLLNQVIQANNGISTANNGINQANSEINQVNNGINQANTGISQANSAITALQNQVNSLVSIVQGMQNSVQAISQSDQVLLTRVTWCNSGDAEGTYQVLDISASKTVKFCVCYQAIWSVYDDYVELSVISGSASIYVHESDASVTTYKTNEYFAGLAGDRLVIKGWNSNFGGGISTVMVGVVVEGPPGTTVTVNYPTS